MPKRRKADEPTDEEDDESRLRGRTKLRRRGTSPHEDHANSSPAARTAATTTTTPTTTTPSQQKSILKRWSPSPKVNGRNSVDAPHATPTSLRKVLFSTPAKLGDGDAAEDETDEENTPEASRNDHSARRKSRRTSHARIAEVYDSSEHEHEHEHEQYARDEAIAQAVLDEDEGIDDQDTIVVVEEPSNVPDTPSKTSRPRGRPTGKRRDRAPSPPPDLPPHELYFFQNRAASNHTSANTVPPHLLLNHEDYFAQVSKYEDAHLRDIRWLKSMHKRAFDQWAFELEEGFNLCLYGYGSKRELLMALVDHVYTQADKLPKIVVVNGYAPGLIGRDILLALARVILPKSSTKLPTQPPELLDLLLESLTSTPAKQSVICLIHSLDHPNLRKFTTQTLLARLASHQSISLITSCDTPNFPLLWDLTLNSQFKFVFHDATTFDPYDAEVEVIEDVNSLLGRSSRRLGGKDGVGYVLKSLPENARNLFRILVAEQLASADTEGRGVINGAFGDESDPDDMLGVEDEDEAAQEQQTPSRRGKRGRPPKKAKTTPAKLVAVPAAAVAGVEYRMLYHKAVEEFVCSSEVNFRTLLKEFHDHQMIESRKDVLGTERLVVPFRREELESILEELV